MLFTCSLSNYKKTDEKKKAYFLMANAGNDVVTPDKTDLQQMQQGIMKFQGLKINYLTKLMSGEAEKWMKNVAEESIQENIILVSDEEKYEQSYRKMLAEMIINLFSGHMKINYLGELPSN